MDVVYTNHAEERLAERKIPKAVIENTLKNPDSVVAGTFGKKIAQKLIRNKLLRIIYEDTGDKYLVITAYYAEPERYVVVL